jgi:hypothetical protein
MKEIRVLLASIYINGGKTEITTGCRLYQNEIFYRHELQQFQQMGK